LLLAGLAAAGLPGPFVGSGRDPFAFSRIGITLDFEAGCKLLGKSDLFYQALKHSTIVGKLLKELSQGIFSYFGHVQN